MAVTDVLSTAALTTVGLGCDIFGAGVVVRGLFSSRAQIIERSRTRINIKANRLRHDTPFGDEFHADNPVIAYGLIRDKADGASGLAALAFGFLLQAVAAVISTAAGSGAQGTGAALFASATGLATLAVLLLAYFGRPKGQRSMRRWVTGKMLDRTFPDDSPAWQLRNAVRALHEDPDSWLTPVMSKEPFPTFGPIGRY